MLLRTHAIVALEQEKGEPVVRSRKLWRELERTAIAANRVIQSARLGESDGHVLQYLRIVRTIAQRETIRRQRGVEITLPLQRERLAQIIEALGLHVALRLAANEAAPPGHWISTEGQEAGVAAGGARRGPGGKAMHGLRSGLAFAPRRNRGRPHAPPARTAMRDCSS